MPRTPSTGHRRGRTTQTLPPAPVPPAEQAPTNLQDREQLSRSLSGAEALSYRPSPARPPRGRGAQSCSAAVAAGARRRGHPRARGREGTPEVAPRGGSSLRHGSARRGVGLTGRGRRRPGSAEEAADDPERQRRPAAGSRGRQHRRRPGALGELAAETLRGLLRGGALRRARARAGPLRGVRSCPHPCGAPVRPGPGAAGEAQPACGSCRALREPVKCQGEEIQTGQEKAGGAGGGERRRGLPRPLPPGRGKKIATGRGGSSEERGPRERRGARRGRGAAGAAAGERAPRRRAA